MRDLLLNSATGSLQYPQNYEADKQKRALDKLVDKQYNKIHEDAFEKLISQKKGPILQISYRVIWSLWQERNRFKSIMKTQDFEYAKLLKENEGLRAEIEKMRNTKGDYGAV